MTFSPNQPMKLTPKAFASRLATARRFADVVLVTSFLSPQIGLTPSGRSLSFSR
jgi:hypothetical protein